MSMIYGDGDYAFINTKVDDSFVFPNPVFRFAPRAVRREFTYDEVQSLVKSYGGYIITGPKFRAIEGNAGYADKYSVGNFYSIFDLYFGDGFAAIVYRSDSECGTIYMNTHSDSELEHFTFSDLTPDKYLATDINRTLGLATGLNRWFALGHNFWQEIDIGEGLSAVKADYYCMKGPSMLAAFGVHATRMPWLYVPQNEKAGSAIAQIYRGNVKVSDGKVEQIIPFNYMCKDLGNDGICFTSDLKIQAKALREKLGRAQDIASLDAFKKAVFPGWSNDDAEWHGIIQYVLPKGTTHANLETTQGVIYCHGNGQAELSLDIDCLTANDALVDLEGYKYILNDSAINEALYKADQAYEIAKTKQWFECATSLRDAVIGIVGKANVLARTVAGDCFSELNADVKRKIEEVGLNSSNISMTGAAVPEVVQYEAPELPDAASSNMDVAKTYVRATLAQFGKGLKYKSGDGEQLGEYKVSLSSELSPALESEIRTTVRSKIKAGVLAPINAAIASLAEQLNAMTVSLDQKKEYSYKVFFKTKYNEPWYVYKGAQNLNLRDNTSIKGVTVTISDNKMKIHFDLSTKLATRRLHWESSDSALADTIKNNCRILNERTGWNCQYRTEGDIVERKPAGNKGGWWITFTTHRKISALFKYQRGPGLVWPSDPDYDEVRYQEWYAEKVFPLSLGEQISYNPGATSEEVEAFMSQAEHDASIAGLIAYCRVLYDYRDEFAGCRDAIPLVKVKGFLTTPQICNQFFNSAFSNPAATAAAIVKIRGLAEAEQDDTIKQYYTVCAQILDDLNSQYYALVNQNAEKMGWLAANKLSNLTYVPEVDIAPLAMWMLREQE